MTIQLSKGGRLAILGVLVAVAGVVVAPKFVHVPYLSPEEEETPAISAAEREALRDAARARRAADAAAQGAAPAGPASASVATASLNGAPAAASAPVRAVAGAKAVAAKANAATDIVNAVAADAPPAAATPAQAKTAVAAARKSAASTPAAPAAVAAPARVRVAERSAAETTLRTLTLDREVFAYPGAVRRDPFKSLMAAGDLRPLLSEVRLTSVAFDGVGGNSIAILRDIGTKAQYRVRTGQRLGRMRVARILPKSIVFTIEELGYSRQETLALTDSITGVQGK